MIAKIILNESNKVLSKDNTFWVQGSAGNNIYLYIEDESVALVELTVIKPGGKLSTQTVKFLAGFDEEGIPMWYAPDDIPATLFDFTIYTGTTATAMFSFKLHSQTDLLDFKYKLTVDVPFTIQKSGSVTTANEEDNDTQQWRAIGRNSNGIIGVNQDLDDHIADDSREVHDIGSKLDALTIQVTSSANAYTDEEIAELDTELKDFINSEDAKILDGTDPFTKITINDTTSSAEITYNGTDIVAAYRGINHELGKNLFTEVEPVSGITFTDGMVVQYAGSVGLSGRKFGKPAVPAEINAKPELLLGVVTAVTNEGNAIVNYYGEVNGINTSAYTLGDPVYFASASGSNGQFTKTIPTAPNAIIQLGIISRVHLTQGTLDIRMDIHENLRQSSDVYSPTINDKNILSWNSSNGRFENYDLDLKADLSYVDDPTTGKADLVGGLVPSYQLPSYVDDVIEVATYAALPATGETSKLYIVVADETSSGNHSTYRWTGTVYVKVHDQMSAAEIKTLYESNADTNEYTDAEKTKLSYVPANFNTTIANYYTKAQTDALLNNLKAIYGWQDEVIATLTSDANTIAKTSIDAHDLILLQYMDDDVNKVFTETFKPSILASGDAVELVSGVTISHDGTTYTASGMTSDDTLTIIGIKMDSENAASIAFDDTDTSITAANVQEALELLAARTPLDTPIAALNNLSLREIFEESSILNSEQLVTNGDFSNGTTGWMSLPDLGVLQMVYIHLKLQQVLVV